MSRQSSLPDVSTARELLTAGGALQTPALQEVSWALPDEDEAARMLNVRLVALRLRLERDGSDPGWRLRAEHGDAAINPTESDVVLLPLVRLIEADGWHRIKRCRASGCDVTYIDLTNGSVRKFCDRHRSRPRAS